MVDREVVRRHLQSLEEAVTVLRRHRSTAAAALARDVERRYIVERALQVAIQNVLDIGNHLLTATGRRQPEDYTEIIAGLAEARIIPRVFARRISKMPGLRNILVHEYVRVHPAKLRAVLRNHLDDFPRFARHLERWLAIDHSPP
jgi:uncharacterized protein YutE (UPF0331/DUF86 family)